MNKNDFKHRAIPVIKFIIKTHRKLHSNIQHCKSYITLLIRTINCGARLAATFLTTGGLLMGPNIVDTGGVARNRLPTSFPDVHHNHYHYHNHNHNHLYYSFVVVFYHRKFGFIVF